MLYYKTVTSLLHQVLLWLMKEELFLPFRLVGGTSLSLQLGHRESVDIDLFTDAEYGSIDFKEIDTFLKANFPYVDTSGGDLVGMGRSYYIGQNPKQSIKLDLFYSTEPFIRPVLLIDGIRFAQVEEIIAMKMEVIAHGGRKKDFWDLHELLGAYPLPVMLQLHQERYPYQHDRDEILRNLVFFDDADNDFDPICLKYKYWEVIKLDFLLEVERLLNNQSL